MPTFLNTILTRRGWIATIGALAMSASVALAQYGGPPSGGGYGGGGNQGPDLSKGYWEKTITYNGSLEETTPTYYSKDYWTKFGPDYRTGGVGPGGELTLTTSGSIHFKFKWISGTNNVPAPKKVLLAETGSASSQAPLHNLKCESKVVIEGQTYPGTLAPPTDPNVPPTIQLMTVSKTVWILKDVPTTGAGSGIIEFDISPSADMHGKSIPGDPLSENGAYISYGASASLWNVQVDLKGTTEDAQKNLHLLTGQACEPNLAMPGLVKELAISRRDNLDSWQSASAPTIKKNTLNKPLIDWEITGAGIFKSFQTGNPGGMVALSASDKQKVLKPQFFDRMSENVQVECLTATLDITSTNTDVRAPLPAITNTQAKLLSSDKPTCTAENKRGWVQIYQPSGYPGYGMNWGSFAHNGVAGTTTTQGENWRHVQYLIPQPFANNVGSGCFGQLITLNRQLFRNVSTDLFGNPLFPPRYVHPQNGNIGLDYGFPYGLASGNAAGEGVPPLAGSWNLPFLGFGGDSPRQTLGQQVNDGGGTAWYQSTANDSMSTWIFFVPPAKDGLPTSWVPMQTYSWGWAGTADRTLVPPSPWTLSGTNPAGPGIIDGPAWTNTDDFPNWTRVHPSPFSLVPG